MNTLLKNIEDMKNGNGKMHLGEDNMFSVESGKVVQNLSAKTPFTTGVMTAGFQEFLAKKQAMANVAQTAQSVNVADSMSRR